MIVASGQVYGRNWNFGYNSYPARIIEADTYEEIKDLLATLPMDHFDEGMGYETVMGVHYNLIIETVQDGEWTKTRTLKPLKKGILKGTL